MRRLEVLLAEAGDAHDGLTLWWEGGQLVAELAGGRSQALRCEETDGSWRFSTRVATHRDWADRGEDELARRLLVRNRTAPIVTFGLDGRRRVIASVEHPAETLQPEELRLLLSTLARQADRLERELTGRDRY